MRWIITRRAKAKVLRSGWAAQNMKTMKWYTFGVHSFNAARICDSIDCASEIISSTRIYKPFPVKWEYKKTKLKLALHCLLFNKCALFFFFFCIHYITVQPVGGLLKGTFRIFDIGFGKVQIDCAPIAHLSLRATTMRLFHSIYSRYTLWHSRAMCKRGLDKSDHMFHSLMRF